MDSPEGIRVNEEHASLLDIVGPGWVVFLFTLSSHWLVCWLTVGLIDWRGRTPLGDWVRALTNGLIDWRGCSLLTG
jgi:hypothetical protein